MEYFCSWPISSPYARFYCNTFISAIGPFEWGNRVRSSYILTLTLFVYKICETPQDDFGPCHHKEVLNPRPGAKAEVVKMRPTSPCTKTGWSHGINFQLVGIIPLFFLGLWNTDHSWIFLIAKISITSFSEHQTRFPVQVRRLVWGEGGGGRGRGEVKRWKGEDVDYVEWE